MKKIALTLCALALISYSFAQELALAAQPDPFAIGEKAAFNWGSTTFDFGKIKAGIPVTHEFIFSNAGNIPLVISSVKPSCGCTVATFTKEPVQSALKGFVKATYNAAKTGSFVKTITVQANTAEGVVILTIKGEVTE